MTDDFLKAIGAVTVQFAGLEMQLSMATWTLLVGTELKHQDLGRIVTADLSFQKHLDLFAALARRHFPDREDEIKSLCATVSQAANRRNAIVHSTWAAAPNDNVMRITPTARGRLKVTFDELSTAQIRAIADEIRRASESLLNFHVRLIDPNAPQLTL